MYLLSPTEQTANTVSYDTAELIKEQGFIGSPIVVTMGLKHFYF
jgi:hypothetical protein